MLYEVITLFVFIGGVFAGIGVVMPKIPDSMINVPHREYWLAPKRRSETLAVMRRALDQMGVATLAFLLALMIMTFEANGDAAPRLGMTSWGIIIVYFGITAWQVIRLVTRFRLPKLRG